LVSKSDGEYCNTKYDLSGYGEFTHDLSKEAPKDIKIFPLMLFGDDIAINLVAANGSDNDDYIYQTGVYVDNIYYTSDKTEEVKKKY